MDYFERIRDVAKELIEETEYVNAHDLYKRILPMFKNMPRSMRDILSEEEKTLRMDSLHVLLLNIAFCQIKRGNFREAIKACKEANEAKDGNPKAYYRLGCAQKANGELEPAKESLTMALKLAPADQAIRNEYKALMELMNVKHKEWYQRMNGFLHSDKMKEIEGKDEEERLLKEKLLKKGWGKDWEEENA